MSYLGKVALKASDIRRLNVTSSTSATHTLSWTPPNEQSLIITINGVKQQNNYTISGTTLTLDTALTATDAMEVVGINDIGTTNVPGSGVITNDMVSPSAAIAQSKLATLAIDTAELADDAVTTAKIEDDAVTADKLANSINTEIAANTAKVTNATHTGDVTGATALTIANDAVDIAMLSATGTASASTFLRGDNAWAAAGGFKPAFFAWRSANQSITTTTWTKVEYNLEVFDEDDVYDNTTNYRFTVPSGGAGKYCLHFSNRLDVPAGSSQLTSLYINGSGNTMGIAAMCDRTWHGDTWANNTVILDLADADYCEIFSYHPSGSSQNLSLSYFHGFKLVGV